MLESLRAQKDALTRDVPILVPIAEVRLAAGFVPRRVASASMVDEAAAPTGRVAPTAPIEPSPSQRIVVESVAAALIAESASVPAAVREPGLTDAREPHSSPDIASTVQALTRRQLREAEASAASTASASKRGRQSTGSRKAKDAQQANSVRTTGASRRAEAQKARAVPVLDTLSAFTRLPRKHLVLAMSGGLVLAAVATGTGLTVNSSATSETAAADTVLGATALPVKLARSVVLTSVSGATGTVSGGASVTLTGSGLDSIASVTFGGVAGTVTNASAGQATITAPARPDQATGTVDVAFYDAAGQQITFDAVTDAAASATTAAASTGSETTAPTDATASSDGSGTEVASSGSTPLPADGTVTTDAASGAASGSADASALTSESATTDSSSADATASTEASSGTDGTTSSEGTASTDSASTDPASTPAATPSPTTSTSPSATAPTLSTKVIASALAFNYTVDPAVAAAALAAAQKATALAAQLAYVDTYWSDYNSAEYGVISGNDCVNFTSQSLIARGWTMDSEWSYSSSGGYSSAWASSTAFAAYMASHPERGTQLSNSQRDEVAVGDVVQFDWDGSGDWDHTGVVTKISGGQIYYSSHTSDNHDQSIDSASAGRIIFWHLA